MKTCRTHGPGNELCRFCFRVVVTVLLVFCFRTVTYYTSRFPICQILWPNFVHCVQSSFRNFVKSVCFCAEKTVVLCQTRFLHIMHIFPNKWRLLPSYRSSGALRRAGFSERFPSPANDESHTLRCGSPRLSRNYSFADNLCLRRGEGTPPYAQNTDVRKFPCGGGVRAPRPTRKGETV